MKTWPRIFGLTPGELTWLVAGVALLVYELWAIATRGGDVLTRAMRAGIPRWTSIDFGLGVLMGHLTGPSWGAFPYSWTIPFGGLAVFLARDVILGGRIDVVAVTPIFILGYVLGVFWPGSP